VDDDTFVFGSFELHPAQRTLLRDGKPLRLGARASEILIALVQSAGETVPRKTLVARTWPHSSVEESALRVHVAALRRALGESDAGEQYIANIPGRGYRFIAPVIRGQRRPATVSPTARSPGHSSLPAPLAPVVGRAEVIATLAAQLPQHRFLTIVGPGGIGKTTVAIAVADIVSAACEQGAWFVDLASLSDPDLVPSALSIALGISLPATNLVPGLAEWLRDKHALIVLDSCEHVIGPVAILAEAILRTVPSVCILATSREPLRAEGEWVHRLASLELPPVSDSPTTGVALQYSAVELFNQRASSIMDGFTLSDANVGAVLEVCRRLDGLPLALELAAARIDAFGVNGLAALLDDRFSHLTKGRRTALPRQQTLRATMDWSYELLPETEQGVLRRLAVFRGNFTIDAAAAIASHADITADDVFEAVANLAAKSLVTTDVSGDTTYHRLLDTTRAYALDKLELGDEAKRARRRHADYYRDLFERAEAERETRPASEWLVNYGPNIDNVRTALDWTFSSDGDVAVGLALTVAAVPAWVQMSLVEECRIRVAEALARLVEVADPDARLGMKLFAALGGSLLFTKGPMSETAAAWTKAFELAERVGDVEYQLRALWGLWVYHMNCGQFGAGLILAQRFFGLATDQADAADLAIADRMIGVSFHYRGDQAKARVHIERMLTRYIDPVRRAPSTRFVYDQRVVAQVALARILWLQGFPDQAWRMAQATVEAACALNQPVTACFTLAEVGCPLALFIGDLAAADRYVALLLDRSSAHSLLIWQSWAHRFKGTLLIRQGAPEAGAGVLRASLDQPPEASFQPRFTWFLGQLAQGLAHTGQLPQALSAVGEALMLTERNEDRWCVAELLRIKGDLLTWEGAPTSAAEACFTRSLEWARQQGALSWELRSATSLARLWRDQERQAEARALLAPVYGRLTEGLATADPLEAKRLLDELG
jgi:predicted ATPase/DNA-binding winged helix-turn-helix (wHTH) protein